MYSPDLVLADFFLLPKLKTLIEGKRFAMIEKVKEKSAISKNAFQKCFEDGKKRWLRCIISEGGYFKGDKIVIDK